MMHSADRTLPYLAAAAAALGALILLLFDIGIRHVLGVTSPACHAAFTPVVAWAATPQEKSFIMVRLLGAPNIFSIWCAALGIMFAT